MEFPLDFVYYLYNYYTVYILLSHTHYVISCDVTLWHVTHSYTPSLYSKSKRREKKKKRNINNNLAILPSHNTNTLCWNYEFHIFQVYKVYES